MYSYTLFDSIDDIDTDVWASLCEDQDDIFVDPRFVRAVERGSRSFAKMRYVLFYDATGRTVASTCYYSYVLNASHLASGRAKSFVGWAGRIVPWLTRYRLIICGLPVGAGQSSLRMSDDVNVTILLAMLDRILLHAASEFQAIAIIWREFSESECERLEPVLALGYRREAQFSMHHATADDASFAAYCHRIKSSKRRVIKKSQKKFATSGLEIVHKTGRQQLSDVDCRSYYRLFEAVLDGKQTFEILPVEFFGELTEQLPENVILTLVVKGSEIKAFAASVGTETVFRQLFVGYDIELNSECDLYFNLWFHVLDYALQGGYSDIVLGQTCDTFKIQKLGAWQDGRSYFTKGLTRFASLLLRISSSGLESATKSA